MGVLQWKEQIDIPSYGIWFVRRLKFHINVDIRKIIVTQMDQICLLWQSVYIVTTIESQYWMFSWVYARNYLRPSFPPT